MNDYPETMAGISAFIIAVVIAWLWQLFMTPRKIRHFLSVEKISLLQLKKRLKIGAWDFVKCAALAFLVSAGLVVLAFFYLYRYESDATWWLIVVNSWLADVNLPFVEEFRPVPLGMILAAFIGLFLGGLTGTWVGRRFAGKKILITGRLYSPVKS